MNFLGVIDRVTRALHFPHLNSQLPSKKYEDDVSRI
jgi:hypothetical protein